MFIFIPGISAAPNLGQRSFCLQWIAVSAQLVIMLVSVDFSAINGAPTSCPLRFRNTVKGPGGNLRAGRRRDI